MLQSCYYSHPNQADHWVPVDNNAIDSVNFQITHHYWKGYNFVATDSLVLLTKPGKVLSSEEAEDSMIVLQHCTIAKRHTHVVVADIRKNIGNDSATIWLNLATDNLTQGWISEKDLLAHATPDEEISKFIFFFSDKRTIIFLSLFGLSILTLILSLIIRRRLKQKPIRLTLRAVGHWLASSAGLMAPNGWKGAHYSFYPTLFCLVISLSATLYGSIQHFIPQTWIEYYFNPTLNPFSEELPCIMRCFIASIWFTCISAVALFIDLYRRETLDAAMLHSGGVVCVGIVLYLIFTLTTPLYIGYALLFFYVILALVRYFQKHPRLICGKCGQPISQLGKCPHCGAENM